MFRWQRAKQFAPFEAIGNLQEALRAVEYEMGKVEKKELSEDTIEEISSTLSCIETGDVVEVTFYRDGYYVTIKGGVRKLSAVYKFIQIEEGRINFADLYDIKRL